MLILKSRVILREMIMKVNSETLKLLGKELPWVYELMLEDTKRFYVKLMDLEVLSLNVKADEYDRFPWQKVYLIDGRGRVIGLVGVKTEPIKSCRFIWRPPFFQWYDGQETVRKEFSESLDGAIKRIGDIAWDTRYIVELDFREITIHKLPNRAKSMREWLDQKSAEASEQLHKVLEG